jgi:hypothetical protein
MQHLLRKQIIGTALLIICSLSIKAQKNEVFQPDHDDMPYYLGISLGYGMNSLNFERSAYFNNQTTNIANKIHSSTSGNLNLGLSGTLKLTNHLLLRANPMLLIGGSKKMGFSAPNNLYVNVADSIEIPSTIITVPLALKLQSDRYTAFGYKSIMRHYAFGGGKADFDLSSSKVSNSFNGTPYKALLNGTDLGYEFGLGLSIYLRYVTISPEIKFSYGLTNLKNTSGTATEPLLNNLNKINANFIYFTIHLEN